MLFLAKFIFNNQFKVSINNFTYICITMWSMLNIHTVYAEFQPLLSVKFWQVWMVMSNGIDIYKSM